MARRMNLLTDLVRETFDETDDKYCNESVQIAVAELLRIYLCNLKFDMDLLREVLYKSGWTDDDFKYFGIENVFTYDEEE